ncbi:Dipeptidyl aminopeptidase/acylaminoacyl peptidase [Parapedobacter luteus]|uniref:Dipeptidyl aminopeptidase/acylaminoacyl peptidase n=1 Tax=Parapedobacter luteus TaxID=623280 RepID=A0A1T4ZVJ9_9SPHI|nr:S9 family peptidase [Parapedobacter luteus]SKB26801.1 Dipeptidyl aminopeptidase/acylaminoacyl peptidase [Parapedobacter luteus]
MKKRNCYTLCLLVCGFIVAHRATGQGTAADYRRAIAFGETTRDKVFYSPTRFSWLENRQQFWYANNTPEGKRFMLVDASKRQKREAFDHGRIATALQAASGEKVDADSLPFDNIVFKSTNQIEFDAFGKIWSASLADYKVLDTGRKPEPPRWGRGSGRYWGDSDDGSVRETPSPDSNWVAYIKNYNVYIRRRNDKGEEIQLSYDGALGHHYSPMIAWSPDSKKLAVNKVRPNTQRKIYFVESSPSTQLQPILQERNYLKPGDALPQNQPVLFLIESKQSFAVDPSLIPNQYSISRLEWRKDSRAFTFEYNQRGHQRYEVFAMDAGNGSVKPLITETSKTFVEYSGKRYRMDINDGKEIIWASERDGWNHLYLYDGESGAVKNQITKGEWVVREVVHVDEDKRQLIFAGSGREAGQDPYFTQYYRINFDGSGLMPLTKEDGNHRATFSADYLTFVDTYSRVDAPPVSVLRSATDGKVLLELEKADDSALLATGWRYPEVFHAKGRDGVTDIWGVIIRPSNFDPNKSYPVIENIYAGPQGSFVPKNFSTQQGMAALAELGFIVVQIDGMGTSNRSKAFHDVCWKNLKDAGFPDRILWMKAAAAKYSYMNLSRVGIYGTSAGGQNAAGAVLFHPEFYKVAVSSCGCHDNRMDKMWWNEQWMGYPIGPQYAECSNVENAHKLEGKLMLIVGEVDDNVDPASTMQVVDALIKANKEHELVVLPGAAHTSGGPYGERKRRDFFVKHLLGVDPPIWEGQQAIATR